MEQRYNNKREERQFGVRMLQITVLKASGYSCEIVGDLFRHVKR